MENIDRPMTRAHARVCGAKIAILPLPSTCRKYKFKSTRKEVDDSSECSDNENDEKAKELSLLDQEIKNSEICVHCSNNSDFDKAGDKARDKQSDLKSGSNHKRKSSSSSELVGDTTGIKKIKLGLLNDRLELFGACTLM